MPNSQTAFVLKKLEEAMLVVLLLARLLVHLCCLPPNFRELPVQISALALF